MTPYGTIKINKEKISEKILSQISDNLYEDFYLIFQAEKSANISRTLKDQIFYEVLTRHMKESVLKQPDFERFYRAIVTNIRSNLEYLRHVKVSGLLPPLYKEEMMVNLILDQLDHEMMLSYREEEKIDDEELSKYDDVISMYGDIPPVNDSLGREIRIQLYIIKNSELHFADPEKRAELLEDLLLDNDSDEFREFFIVDSLYRSMCIK